MTKVTTHPAGAFCWIELATRDTDAARDFYTSLFGWTYREIPMNPEEGMYTIFQKDGHDAGAMYRDTRLHPRWVSYIAVDDVDESVRQVQSLGGQVHTGPLDVYDKGRTASVVDPQGAMFALWQPRKRAGVGVRDEANALCWNELQAREVDTAKTFYTSLFGWRMKESPDYTEWHLGEHAAGGMLRSQAPAEVPSFWLAYFAVDDCEAAVEKAKSLSGALLAGPMDIENVGRFAVLADSQGATFAVIRLSM